MRFTFPCLDFKLNLGGKFPCATPPPLLGYPPPPLSSLFPNEKAPFLCVGLLLPLPGPPQIEEQNKIRNVHQVINLKLFGASSFCRGAAPKFLNNTQNYINHQSGNFKQGKNKQGVATFAWPPGWQYHAYATWRTDTVLASDCRAQFGRPSIFLKKGWDVAFVWL